MATGIVLIAVSVWAALVFNPYSQTVELVPMWVDPGTSTLTPLYKTNDHSILVGYALCQQDPSYTCEAVGLRR